MKYKRLRPIDKHNGTVCAVWQNSPEDSAARHSAIVITHKTLNGKTILVCERCKAELMTLQNFLNRTPFAPKESMITETVFVEGGLRQLKIDGVI